ncbi:response regulator [Gammaproteobacteria bacterium AB-CW1]|uniref:histidine kinase n=1 Tax=Natronospira elongata TaxID=3110268 RepID=A0AAP6MK89_9GAMM|nr:response regulator [Gammaproteobacteria bacterium AB-CW1]
MCGGAGPDKLHFLNGATRRRLWSAAVLLLFLLVVSAAHAEDTERLQENVERLERLNIQLSWRESQASIEDFRRENPVLPPPLETRLRLLELRNRGLSGDEAGALAEMENLPVAELPDEIRLRAEVLRLNLATNATDYQTAFEALIQGRELLERVDSPELSAAFLGRAAVLLGQAGQHAEALELSREALAEAHRTLDPREVCAELLQQGLIVRRMGAMASLASVVEEGLPACERAGDPVLLAVKQRLEGEARLFQGNVDEAVELLEEALEAVNTAGYAVGALEGRLALAAALIGQGSYTRAGEVLDGLAPELAEAGRWWSAIQAHQLQAQLFELDGAYDLALEQERAVVDLEDRKREEEQAARSARMQAQFLDDRRTRQMELLAQSRREEGLRRNVAIGGTFFLLLLGGVVYNRFRLGRDAARQIQRQNEQLGMLATLVRSANRYRRTREILQELMARLVRLTPALTGAQALVLDLESSRLLSLAANGGPSLLGPGGYQEEAVQTLLSQRGRELSEGLYHLEPGHIETLSGEASSGSQQSSGLIGMTLPVENRLQAVLFFALRSDDRARQSELIAVLSRVREHARAMLSSARQLEDIEREYGRCKEAVEELSRTERQLKAAVQQAREAGEARMHFLARISHELRTPLHAILGFSQKLERRLARQADDDEVPAPVPRNLAVVQQAGTELVTLVDNLLDASRMEAGQMSRSDEPIRLRPFLQECLALVNSSLQANGNEAVLALEEAPELIESDPARLRQILLNLLSNAAKFTHRGRVELSAFMDGDGRPRIRVTDSGSGLDPETRRRLSRLFRDKRSDLERFYEDKGLGLVVTRGLCDLLDIQLELKSEPGRGTSVSLLLPEASVAAHAPALAARTDQGQGAAEAPASVLVVEDNRVNRELMVDFVRSEGCRALVAADGETGLSRLRSHPSDLVLLDVDLPGMSGIDLLRWMRGDPALRDIPVIVVTAVDSEHYREQAEALGCVSYELKPLDFRRLAGLIRDQLPGEA